MMPLCDLGWVDPMHVTRPCEQHYLRLSLCKMKLRQQQQIQGSGHRPTPISVYFFRTAVPFCLPALLFLLGRLVHWLMLIGERREAGRLKKLEARRLHLIKELKVSL